MTTNTEIERFRQDHATPEAVAAFFSGVGPDASREAIASAFQAGGYAITPSDLSDLTKDDRSDHLSDQDLDGVYGGMNGTTRMVIGAMTFGGSEAVFKYYFDKHGINVDNISSSNAFGLLSHEPVFIKQSIEQSRRGKRNDT